MIIQDSSNNLYKTGLKLDYSPKKINLSDDFKADSITHLACGRRHYAAVNSKNQIITWGSVFKAKSTENEEGFDLYYVDDIFEGGKIVDISMKYSIFGALIDHK